VVDELRTDVTKTRKDGSPGRLRMDYGDARDPQAAIAWLWNFAEGAKTAGSRTAVPSSSSSPSSTPRASSCRRATGP
jgi:hypothetical protein